MTRLAYLFSAVLALALGSHAASADPDSGLRDIREVTDLALQYGLRMDEDRDLPANNRLLVFVKEPG